MTRNHLQKPDLFMTAAVRKLLAPLTDQPAKTPERSTPRHVLPKNLPEAIKQLDDQELNRLVAAALAEQRQRGKKQSVSNQEASEQVAERAPSSLKRGQINAVRAAFKAGVKSPQIARQFGISRSDVRKALASEEAER